jgi:hypothetical protein
MSITMIGLDTAKSVFQVHAVDDAGKAVMRRKLRRSELIPSSSSRRPVRSSSRPAARRTTGPVCWAASATR